MNTNLYKYLKYKNKYLQIKRNSSTFDAHIAHHNNESMHDACNTTEKTLLCFLKKINTDRSNINNIIKKLNSIVNKYSCKIEEVYNCVEHVNFLPKSIYASVLIGGLGPQNEQSCRLESFITLANNVNKNFHIFPFGEFKTNSIWFKKLSVLKNATLYPIDDTKLFFVDNKDDIIKIPYLKHIIHKYLETQHTNDVYATKIDALIFTPLSILKYQLPKIAKLLTNKNNVILLHCVKCGSRTRFAFAVLCILYFKMDEGMINKIDKIHTQTSFSNNFIKEILLKFICLNKELIKKYFDDNVDFFYNMQIRRQILQKIDGDFL